MATHLVALPTNPMCSLPCTSGPLPVPEDVQLQPPTAPALLLTPIAGHTHRIAPGQPDKHHHPLHDVGWWWIAPCQGKVHHFMVLHRLGQFVLTLNSS